MRNDSESAVRLEGRAALSHFLLAPELLHLNHGSYGALPKTVAAEQDRWRAQMERDPTSFFQFTYPDAVRKSASVAASLFGGAARDWVFVENATVAVNSVLASLDPQPGDELVTTSHAYGAVSNAMRVWAARRGANVTLAHLPSFVESDEEIVEIVSRALSPKTKLLVIDHITSATAIVFPVARIIEAAHKANIPVLVDGAHAPGQIALDVPQLDADWYTGNAHKWLFAPKGCGLLWTAPQHQALTRPAVLSHGAFEGYTHAFDWVGTRDITPWLCLEAAANAHAGFGGAALMERNKRLADEGAALLMAQLAARPSAPPKMRASMVALSFAGAKAPDKAQALSLRRRLLEEFGIVLPVFGFDSRLWVRLSAQIYNDHADYEALVRTLRVVLPI